MQQDDTPGSIEVGKRARITVLDTNLFDIQPQNINETEVLLTIFDGAVVYRKTSAG